MSTGARNCGKVVSCARKVEPFMLLPMEEFGMARKRYSDEDCQNVLPEIELHLAGGMDVPTACRTAGISDATYYNRRKKLGGMARSDLAEKKALEKEN